MDYDFGTPPPSRQIPKPGLRRRFADEADATAADLIGGWEFTAEDAAYLYHPASDLMTFSPLGYLDAVVGARGNDGHGPNRDWHESNSYDFIEGYTEHGWEVTTPAMFVRLAALTRNHLIRGEDLEDVRQLLRDRANFQNPEYLTLIRAYKAFTGDRTFNPRRDAARGRRAAVIGHGMNEQGHQGRGPLTTINEPGEAKSGAGTGFELANAIERIQRAADSRVDAIMREADQSIEDVRTVAAGAIASMREEWGDA